MISMCFNAPPRAIAALFMIVVLAGCGKSDEVDGPPPGPTYESIVSDGWTLYTQNQYAQARDKFAEAKTTDSTRSEAYAGRGWSLFKLPDLTQSAVEFTSGSTRSNPVADVFAGWAFLLNAQKNYAGSNSKIDQALAKDSAWSFSHGQVLRVKDLRVLKAENCFMLGNFVQSLAEVRKVNGAFNADVTTSAGLSQLAGEIERLKSSP